MSKAKTKTKLVLHRPGCTLVVEGKTYRHGDDCGTMPEKVLKALVASGDVREVTA